MKTILIVIAGIADLPDPKSGKETPLSAADIPALDMLAQRGDFTAFPSMERGYRISHQNALLSILGYDLAHGQPSIEELMEFGLDASKRLSDFPSLRPFVIPLFSGHGVAVTTSAWVRGAAKCALLRPLDIYSPGASYTVVLDTMATLAQEAISGNNEFVLVYVDSPLKASLRGDYQSKITALENIDRHLISPIADFVWKSDLFINMAVTTDLTTSWWSRNVVDMRVPLVTYFNNHDWDGDPEHKFTEVQSLLMPEYFYHPSDLIRYLYSFHVAEEETQNPNELPF